MLTASCGTTLVAAMTRTSTEISWRPPRRRKIRSCSTRSSLTCVAGIISAISSRKSVPRCASSNTPVRRSDAPVNAPFSWPKISLSSSVSGIAAQLIATNGNVARGLSSWIVCAMSSLPVPDSPEISTDADVGADCSITRYTVRMPALFPMIRPKLPCSRSCRRRVRTSRSVS